MPELIAIVCGAVGMIVFGLYLVVEAPKVVHFSGERDRLDALGEATEKGHR